MNVSQNTVPRVANMDERFCQHDLNYQRINGTNVELVILGRCQQDPGHLTCVALLDAPIHTKMMKKIEKDCVALDEEPIHKPVIGEIVLAKTDGFGYLRSKCLGMNGRILSMFAIDYGAVFSVFTEDVRVS